MKITTKPMLGLILALVLFFAPSIYFIGIVEAEAFNDRPVSKGPMSKTTGDFNLGSKFSIEIDGVTVAGVHTIEGIETESIVQYQDGTTLPGNIMPSRMVITKDWSNTLEWHNWRKKILDGKTDRRSISIIIHEHAGSEAGRINLLNCWPYGWGFSSNNSGHAIEKIELSCDHLDF